MEFEELINMIESPCNDVCTTDPESGLCIGCGRTVDEISNWLYYSDKQKKKGYKSSCTSFPGENCGLGENGLFMSGFGDRGV